MDKNASVYDLLNQDSDFVNQVIRIKDSAAQVAEAAKKVAATTEGQQATLEKIEQKTGELTTLIDAAEERLNSMREERKVLESALERHEAVLDEMQRLEDSFQQAIKAYNNIADVYSIFDVRFREMESNIAQQPAAAPVPEVKVPVSARPQTFEKFANVDYDEVTSVENLFKKYNGKIDGPVVVVRTKTFPWNGDYCMAIHSIGKGKAWGVRYSYGNPGKKTPLNATEEDYSMYCGDYYAAIAEDFKNQGK